MVRNVCLLVLVMAVVGHADSLNCRMIGTYDTPQHAMDIAVDDTLLYVADIEDGLRILSVAKPESPYELGFFEPPNVALGVAVKDTVAFIANHNQGLYAVNVADPRNVYEISQVGTPGVAGRLAVSDTLLYVANRDAGLTIFNVADPANMNMVGARDTIGLAMDVAVRETLVYVAAALANGLIVENAADPTLPLVVGLCSLPRQGSGVALSGNHACVAALDFYVINVADPQNPSLVGTLVTPESALDVTVAGSFAYVADGHAGLRVIDISNPAAPQERGFYDTPGNAQGIALYGDYVCVADDDYGVHIIEFSGAGVEEARSRPDASRITPEATVVRGVLWLPREMTELSDNSDRVPRPRVCLLDIAGREVMGLAPGPNDVSRLAPGVYFLSEPSAVGPRHSAIARVVLAR